MFSGSRTFITSKCVSRQIIAVLPLFFVVACSGNILAGAPLGAALANCKRQPDPAHMLPDLHGQSHTTYRYVITAVQVIGPEKSTIPPPLMAVTFGKALETSLRQAGAIDNNNQEQNYVLTAYIVSQNRHGNFSQTQLELTIQYSLRRQQTSDPDRHVWESLITTAGEISDWKTDACARLRKLQENLSKQNIQRLLDKLPTQQ
jgi:hypothetical protein